MLELMVLFFLVPATTLAAGSLPSTLGWYQVPNTLIDDVCAETHGFPQVAGTQRCAILSWSGGVFDSKRNRLIVWGGGHNAYYGNEIYAFNLGNLTMTRLNDPGLPIGSYDTCQDAIAGGTQPNSRHTYDGIEYMANMDRMFVFSGSLACGGGYFGSGTWTFDFATMKWQQMNPAGPIPRGGPGVVTAYDSNTGLVFIHDTYNFYSYDAIADRYTQLNTSRFGYHMSGTIDPKRKKFVVAGYDIEAGSGRVYVIDINTGSSYVLQTLNTTGGGTLINSEYPGIDYDPVTDRIVAWNGGDSVYSLNLDTNTWTTATYSGGPGAVGPQAQSNGTFGRWRYSAASGTFVLVNDTNQNAYVFRLTNGSPPPSDTTPPANPKNATVK